MSYDELATKDALEKIDRLRNDSLADIEDRLHLWRSTLQLRRATIRNQPTGQILGQFPGYTQPVLVNKSFRVTGSRLK